MPALLIQHPLYFAPALLLVDLLLWRLIGIGHPHWRLAARVTCFLLFSLLLFNAGMNPLRAAPWPDDLPSHMIATAVQIAWWLFAARCLTVVLGFLLVQRVGHAGRLLQDVVGALIFLVAIIASAGYVLELPVKGLLATSGVVAIVLGLALQSTLSDVFSGIVLNTTKPYQLEDWVSIDGIEGKVVEIDWRSTYLQTAQGTLAVVPNSLAAKAKVLNLSRPANLYGLSLSLTVSPRVRPRKVIEALERALGGCRPLLGSPAPTVSVRQAGPNGVEYELSGFVAAMGEKREARNQLYDLAFRHLQAAGIELLSDADLPAREHASRARALLVRSGLFDALTDNERDELAATMQRRPFRSGEVLLAAGDVSDQLLIIDTGVVSVTLPHAGQTIEAGRMGPGEVIGEAGVLSGSAWQAQFTALSDGAVYRLDKTVLAPCLEARQEIAEAMSHLLDFRQKASAALLVEQPATVPQRGLMAWLRQHAGRRYKT
ncbi:mechanosensitive ion channel family protein [Pseudomonas sp. ZM23]|uniref:Small-conductance mechanosensitive channel n=1 Tax=Pseudomonas triclosanedens TaxID=2961893 RepID=A0ABY6ZT64_9PSED|nr:mechanosensitive ion channel family protein [Pseudomonas triclosanedens]MCP8466132.1 mechanosensitive ion channel family protein [Pseudomonas triclosanedens]MCP8472367.1 mechanosensitive ion channel family protein [Pseudomonas triclosanedens]MCP8477431.1 mechanosensitive ion channel family protein [Pseudomonas triclosanedens]WAI47235.1 mechanosensitive ion channel family protein [Pseudomonas triclosanedens]